MTLNLDLVANALTDESALHPLLKQFFGRIVHWQCLSFYCEDYGIGVLLDRAGIPSVSFPVLRKLCMLGSEVNRDLNGDLVPFINTAPNLQMLNLPGRFVISRRNVDNYNRINIQDVFDKFPNFFSLGLTESLLYGDVVALTPIAYSSKLEILTVGHHDEWPDSYGSPVFPILRLPSWKVLHLAYEKPGSGPTDSDGVYFEDNY
ncbi:hypothetical protein BDP27DRAFT_1430365 [Rhodocollybia butyracea]|uniref:Uncharacterized protein n=1 Tax=Rhodocollybia butyracea TaxID=206335 RepID=A0A9P5TZF4_9AGAR|nr:hypothetical protein BDP27DRAFT_1430365 [Rhodocollybia butyracea]